MQLRDLLRLPLPNSACRTAFGYLVVLTQLGEPRCVLACLGGERLTRASCVASRSRTTLRDHKTTWPVLPMRRCFCQPWEAI